MKRWLTSHRRSSAVVAGIGTGAMAFLLDGGFATGWTNAALAALIGAVAALVWARLYSPIFAPKPPDPN
jgi:hypothetical protein